MHTADVIKVNPLPHISNLSACFWETESEIFYATYICLKLKDPTDCKNAILIFSKQEGHQLWNTNMKDG